MLGNGGGDTMNGRRNTGGGSRGSGQPRKNSRSGSRPAGRGGSRPNPRSRGAGRTGAIRRDDEPRASRPKTLGGSQIEGRQAVRQLLLAQRRKVQEIWISSELEGDEALDDIVGLARANRVPVAYVARRRLETAARSEAPQGVLARAAEVPEVDLARLIKRREGVAPFLVAVDGVTDPGNLGAIMRSCEGAGVDGIVVPRHRAVHITPTVAKAAAGAIEHVPVAVVPGLPAALARMKDQGIWIVGLDDAADRSLFELGDLAAEGICVVLGAEGAGLSRLVRERCDLVCAIPMLGRVESLNVSAAAALAAYEVRRHR
ncbi:MAG: 23S rRNA (guanosine(2251)-2'-O)-methyltransferase RlmB [Actinobacteria bacterium]|nr:23S rRNA (guanosine(2251)-2'-O)-methyltransferase RlmB [Actinomycetota bacterium]MDA2995364.1 23S rRNA (guanosine(2251)-2'-O)-methyltransferase RlmB [Actinomycetota bacterium]